MALGLGTGIALPGTHRLYPTPGTPRTPLPTREWLPGMSQWSNVAVGLISVDQLTLSHQISGFRGMTEGYNLIKAGNPNDHKCISGND